MNENNDKRLTQVADAIMVGIDQMHMEQDVVIDMLQSAGYSLVEIDEATLFLIRLGELEKSDNL